jgi:hypothetical protein
MPKHEFGGIDNLLKALEQYESGSPSSGAAAVAPPDNTVLSSAIIVLVNEVVRLRRELDGMKSRTAF